MDPDGLSLDGAVARLDLAAFRRLPVLDSASLDRIERSVERARRHGATAMIVRGGREGTFAAGADLNELAKLDALSAWRFARRGQRLFDLMEMAPLVLIAAISGRCIGGAFDLAMACDLRLAEQDAVFSHPGPRMGFITGYGGTSRLPLLAGRSAALVLAGRLRLEAAHALSLGLVSDVVPAGRLDAAAEELAQNIAGTGADRIALIKEALGRLRGSGSRRRLEKRLTALHLAGVGAPCR